MLVISRKTSESIMIGDDIEIVVTEIGSERVKIGIKAPKGIPILRKELLETREMNREAAGTVGKDAVIALQRLLDGGVPPLSDPAVPNDGKK